MSMEEEDPHVGYSDGSSPGSNGRPLSTVSYRIQVLRHAQYQEYRNGRGIVRDRAFPFAKESRLDPGI